MTHKPPTLRRIYNGIRRTTTFTLDPRWSTFAPFRTFTIENGWRPGLVIDNIICSFGFGNRPWGPDTCSVVTPEIHALVAAPDPSQKFYPPGVSAWSGARHYRTTDGLRFDDPIAAYHAWCDARADALYRAADECGDGHIALGLQWHADYYRLRLIPGPTGPYPKPSRHPRAASGKAASRKLT